MKWEKVKKWTLERSEKVQERSAREASMRDVPAVDLSREETAIVGAKLTALGFNNNNNNTSSASSNPNNQPQPKSLLNPFIRLFGVGKYFF